MYSSRDKDNRLIRTKLCYLFILEWSCFYCLQSLFSLMRRDDNTIYDSSLICFSQLVMLKEQIFIVLKLFLQFQHILPTIFIRIWINKCKLDTFHLVCKQIIEFKRESSFVLISNIQDRVRKPKPLGFTLVRVFNAVYWSI